MRSRTSTKILVISFPILCLPASHADVLATFDSAAIAAFQTGKSVAGFDNFQVPPPYFMPLPLDAFADCGIVITGNLEGTMPTYVEQIPQLGHFGPTLSPPNIIGGGGPNGTDFRTPLRFDFPLGAIAIGAHSDWTGSRTRLSAFRADGSLIEQVEGDQGMFMGIRTAENIHHATWVWVFDQGAGGFTLDNVTYLLPPSACTSDLTADRQIGLSDLSLLLSSFGRTDASHADGDFDCDHDVDLSDLSRLLSDFGTICP